MSAQADNIERVSAKIGDAIRGLRRPAGPDVRMEELVRYVQGETTIAPDSPSRILRLLRRRGSSATRSSRARTASTA
jgi:hypothetical protein